MHTTLAKSSAQHAHLPHEMAFRRCIWLVVRQKAQCVYQQRLLLRAQFACNPSQVYSVAI